MKKQQIIFNRLANLITENKNGFTASRNGVKLNIKKGYAVSITNNKAKRINKLINDVLNMNKPLMRTYNYGGWGDENTGDFYLDISLIEQNKNKALQTAKDFNQKAIFDFGKMESINV